MSVDVNSRAPSDGFVKHSSISSPTSAPRSGRKSKRPGWADDPRAQGRKASKRPERVERKRDSAAVTRSRTSPERAPSVESSIFRLRGESGAPTYEEIRSQRFRRSSAFRSLLLSNARLDAGIEDEWDKALPLHCSKHARVHQRLIACRMTHSNGAGVCTKCSKEQVVMRQVKDCEGCAEARANANFAVVPREARCMNPVGGDVAIHRPAGTRAQYAGVRSCGSLHCPMCGPRLRSARRNDYDRALSAFRKQYPNGQFVFITQTVRHKKGDRLLPLLDTLTEARRKVQKRAAFRRFLKDHVVGSITSLEVLFSFENHWHPHVHQVFLVREAIPDDELKLLQRALSSDWHQAVVSLSPSNEPTFKRGVDVREIKSSTGKDGDDLTLDGLANYLTKAEDETNRWGIADEIARGDIKRGSMGGITHYEMLDRPDVFGGQIIEYMTAMRKKTPKMLRPSPGLYDLLDLDAPSEDLLPEEDEEQPTTDEQESGEEESTPEEETCLSEPFIIDRSVYLGLRGRERAFMLDLYEVGDVAALSKVVQGVITFDLDLHEWFDADVGAVFRPPLPMRARQTGGSKTATRGLTIADAVDDFGSAPAADFGTKYPALKKRREEAARRRREKAREERRKREQVSEEELRLAYEDYLDAAIETEHRIRLEVLTDLKRAGHFDDGEPVSPDLQDLLDTLE